MKNTIPYPFKIVAYCLIIIAIGLSLTANIDDFRRGFRDGYQSDGEIVKEWQTFNEWMPEKEAIPWQRASIISCITGFVLLILARDKKDDEFKQALRLKSLMQAFLITYLFVGSGYLIYTESLLKEFEALNLMLVIYIILYGYKKRYKYFA